MRLKAENDNEHGPVEAEVMLGITFVSFPGKFWVYRREILTVPYVGAQLVAVPICMQPHPLSPKNRAPSPSSGPRRKGSHLSVVASSSIETA